MECSKLGKKVVNGRICKPKDKNVSVGKLRTLQKSKELLKEASNTRYTTTVSEELLNQYEKTFGVARQFKQSQLQDPESYFKELGKSDPESCCRLLKRDKDDRDPTVKQSNISTDNNLNNLRSKTKVGPTLYLPAKHLLPSQLTSFETSCFDLKEKQTLEKTMMQQICYTYFNTETLEQINSFELLDPEKYNELGSWNLVESTVNVPKFVYRRSLQD